MVAASPSVEGSLLGIEFVIGQLGAPLQSSVLHFGKICVGHPVVTYAANVACYPGSFLPIAPPSCVACLPQIPSKLCRGLAEIPFPCLFSACLHLSPWWGS